MLELRENQQYGLHKILWQNRYNIIKNAEDRTPEQNNRIKDMNKTFKGTIVPEILTLKERIRDIFLKQNRRMRQ